MDAALENEIKIEAPSLRTLSDEELQEEKQRDEDKGRIYVSYPEGDNKAFIELAPGGVALYRIGVKEGRLPKDFEGLYTSTELATRVIKAYLKTWKPRQVKKEDGGKTGRNKRSFLEGSDNGSE